ncbi:P2X purinoceptor 7-like [Tubulanus polymorphus]|uniref:P2X purinoceptor 7-like n=1 Tax=Tubulanus polymorphus TaxID=672921 RepID=UPI003DA30B07
MSSDEEILDITEIDARNVSNVAPYMFEPLAANREIRPNSDDDNSASSSDDISSDEEYRQLADNTDWCLCRNICSVMEKTRMNVCCQEFQCLKEISTANNVLCITEVHGFRANCLEPEVLKVCFYDFFRDNWPVGDEEPVGELYRHIAYRRFCRWAWGILGRGNRRILPSCVVSTIRLKWPSPNELYTGFEYPAIPERL